MWIFRNAINACHTSKHFFQVKSSYSTQNLPETIPINEFLDRFYGFFPLDKFKSMSEDGLRKIVISNKPKTECLVQIPAARLYKNLDGLSMGSLSENIVFTTFNKTSVHPLL